MTPYNPQFPPPNSPRNSPSEQVPVDVWVNIALLAVMLLLHILLVGSVLLNVGVFFSTKLNTFGNSSFENGRLVGNLMAMGLAGTFALVGLPWVPFNLYGLWTRKKWARNSLIAYWILCLLSVCCFPVAIYPLITLWRPTMKSWLDR